MNAVILDIKKKHAAAMDENGRIVCVRNAGYEIGQQIRLYEEGLLSPTKMIKRIGSTAAAAALILTIGTGTAYAMPYGTITLEGEPSVSYSINCFDRVLSVQALNEEGEALLAELDLRQIQHRKIEQAISATMEQAEQEGYFDTIVASIRIFADTRNESHTGRLQRELDSVAERRALPSIPEAARNENDPVNSGNSSDFGTISGEMPRDEPFEERQSSGDDSGSVKCPYPETEHGENRGPVPDGEKDGLFEERQSPPDDDFGTVKHYYPENEHGENRGSVPDGEKKDTFPIQDGSRESMDKGHHDRMPVDPDQESAHDPSSQGSVGTQPEY